MRLHSPTPLLVCLALTATARAQNGDRAVLWTDGTSACAPCLDDYLIVPEYRTDCGSSRGVPTKELCKKLTLEYLWRYDGKVERRSAPPDPVELHAADALRTLNSGDYGWLHSVKVVSIQGKEDMLVKDVWLADPDWEKVGLKNFTTDITAKLAKIKSATNKEYASKIADVRAEEKRMHGWLTFNHNPNREAVIRLRAKTNSQIHVLHEEQAKALQDLETNETELLKMAKSRGKAQAEALRVQAGLAKEFGGLFHLTGFPTAGLKPGSRFAGPEKDGLQVAVAWRGKSGERVLAALSLLKKPITHTDLQKLIDKRHVRVEAFNQEIVAAKKGEFGGPEATYAARRVMKRLIRNPADEK